jgi:hypothetical protein
MPTDLGTVMDNARAVLSDNRDRAAFDALRDLVAAVDDAADEPLDIAGAKEACDILEVASGNLYRLKGLPEPVVISKDIAPSGQLAAGKIWHGWRLREFRAQRDREESERGAKRQQSEQRTTEAQAKRAAAAE